MMGTKYPHHTFTLMTITRDSLIKELVVHRMKEVPGEPYIDTLHTMYKDLDSKDLSYIVSRYNAEFSAAVTVEEVSTLFP
jgi:hypothetical protein